MNVSHFLIRASYLNYYMLSIFTQKGSHVFDFDSEDPGNTLEGNKPGTVIYQLEGDDQRHEFPPRWYDMYKLLHLPGGDRKEYLTLLLEEAQEKLSNPDGPIHRQLQVQRQKLLEECQAYVQQHPLFESKDLLTTLSHGEFTEEAISHKGRMLLDLTRNCYPVPDFCLLTAESFLHPESLEENLRHAIDNLETMTQCQLGSEDNPLVFAVRCAMPQYIPGLMPTLLNIGVTRTAYQALREMYDDPMANRVYLSTLHTICQMLGIERKYHRTDIELELDEQYQRIREMELLVTEEGHEALLNDAFRQSLELIRHVRNFYVENQDLILTFMQGKQAYPSLILQRMVWTIGNNDSYPGVLYSRHSRTGQGRQIESYRNIFGEEIMTGDVTSKDIAYKHRDEIKHDYPAVYHFDPLLIKLERRYKSPVTIEFAVETRPNQVSLFSVLQLNISEMTGRAALLSAIDLYNHHQIKEEDVMELIKPYHLRQIVSASIDDHKLNELQFFGNGMSVLPRTAISATLCFSINQARKCKARGESVCLCKERFVPEDTITLNEVDAILSITPAAIHVVTACRGYGIPALMDLQSYGIRIENHTLINSEGVEIKQLECLTISSRRQAIYKGLAQYRPARFMKYYEGEDVEIADEEKAFFEQMKQAYIQYQQIATADKATYINDVGKLAQLIRCELQGKPEVAHAIVNNWYEAHSDLYIQQVLNSRMGDHQDQFRLFNLLDVKNQEDLLRHTAEICIAERHTGLLAGSFMLGRFVAKPLKISLWNNLSDRLVAFLLNEYVLYEKYLHVLDEVGEINLTRAHSRIETEGVDKMNISNFELTKFAPLCFSNHKWDQISAALREIEHQENTWLLIEKLAHPVDEVFDMSKPWKKAQIESILKECQ